jgi:hypothetical protein
MSFFAGDHRQRGKANALIVDPGNAVGIAAVSPFEHAPALDEAIDYQVDDGSGSPPLINIVKGGLGILINF